jgi:hypothetical protein
MPIPWFYRVEYLIEHLTPIQNKYQLLFQGAVIFKTVIKNNLDMFFSASSLSNKSP